MTLDELREGIDKIDNELLHLFNKRMGFVKEVGDLKSRENSVVYRPEREKSIIERLQKINREDGGRLTDQAIEELFLQIFAVSRADQNSKQSK
jgi:chorismate mutase/prephenate dehydratase